MKVSVFVTSYNQRAFLTEAIDSVLAQTLQPQQIIVVDDCSKDGSQEVIAGYASRYPGLIEPIYHAENLGVAQTRIQALQAVTGDYVTYVDGDDRLLPTKLEKEARLLQDTSSVQIAYSNNYYMTADGTHTDTWIRDELPPQGNVFESTFARFFPRQSLFRMELVKYDSWKQVGFHDPRLRLYEDFDMRIRLTKSCNVAYFDEPLSEIRQHEFGLSGAEASYHLEALEYIYQKNEPLLQGLEPDKCREIRRGLYGFMGGICRRAAWQMLKKKGYNRDSRMKALKYFYKSIRYDPMQPDYKLLLASCMPQRAMAFGRATLLMARGKHRQGLD